MAYGNQSNGNQQRGNYGNRSNGATTASKATAGTVAGRKPAVFRTGLFAPKAGSNVKAIASVQLKEDVVLKAGQFINMYKSDSENPKGPVYNLTVTEGSKSKVSQ